jgi:hypothetical protein
MADGQVWHRRPRRAGAGHGQCLQQRQLVIEQQQLSINVSFAVDVNVGVGIAIGVFRGFYYELPAERDALHQWHGALAAHELEPARRR